MVEKVLVTKSRTVLEVTRVVAYWRGAAVLVLP